MLRKSFISGVILTFVVCNVLTHAAVETRLSPRAKREADDEDCAHGIKSCANRYAKYLQHYFTESELKEFCQNYKPFYNCVDDIMSRCPTAGVELSKEQFRQLSEGSAALCNDPKVAKLVAKSENNQCFASSAYEQKADLCRDSFTKELKQKSASERICENHQRFQSCLDSALSGTCSKESRTDYIYMNNLLFSGITKANNIQACWGKSYNGSSAIFASSIFSVLGLCVITLAKVFSY